MQSQKFNGNLYYLKGASCDKEYDESENYTTCKCDSVNLDFKGKKVDVWGVGPVDVKMNLRMR